MNIQEEFENHIFEAIKETEKLLKYADNKEDAARIKKELEFLKEKYPFFKKLDEEFKLYNDLYKIMNKSLITKEEGKAYLKVVPFDKRERKIN